MARQTYLKMLLSADWNALGRADAVIPWFRPFVLINRIARCDRKALAEN